MKLGKKIDNYKPNEQVKSLYCCNPGSVCRWVVGVWCRVRVHAVWSGKLRRVEWFLLLLPVAEHSRRLHWLLLCLLFHDWGYLRLFQAWVSGLVRVWLQGPHRFLQRATLPQYRPGRRPKIQLHRWLASVPVERLRWRGCLHAWGVWRRCELHCLVCPQAPHSVLQRRYLHQSGLRTFIFPNDSDQRLADP